MSNPEFASASFTVGQLNAMVKMLGGRDRAKLFLGGKLHVDYNKLGALVSPDGRVSLESFMRCLSFWEQRKGIIYFSVTSDGTTGPQWIDRLRECGWSTSSYSKRLLQSPEFKPTTGVTTKVAVFDGALFGARVRKTREIYHAASLRRFDILHPEVACLTAEMFSGTDIELMGLENIVVMHPPIQDPQNGNSCISLHTGPSPFLNAYIHNPDCMWGERFGFAFEVSEISK